MAQNATNKSGAATNRYPLSYVQDWFCSLDKGDDNGGFGDLFQMTLGLSIAGRVNLSALQGALDDVVERHELLRTVVARDASPSYQQVYPPCSVPMEVRDLSAAGRPRDEVVDDLLIEAKHSGVSARQAPLMRVVFGRFDDNDSVLVFVIHHTAADAQSLGVIIRDLAACYDARVNEHPADLPPVKQYRDFAQWQKTGAGRPADDMREYWRDKLRGAHVFALPNDRPVPKVYSRPFSAYNYLVGADVMAPAAELAADTGSTMFMVMMAAFSVFIHEMTGQADPAVRAFSAGRGDPQFNGIVSLCLNLVPLRTDVGRCESFREIIASTKQTCDDAYANEIPIAVIEQDMPDFNAPHADPRNSELILAMYQVPGGRGGGGPAFPIADGARPVIEGERASSQTEALATGMIWGIAIGPSGELAGNVVYNVDEFDDQKVTGWVADFNRLLARLAGEPDGPWRQLAALAARDAVGGR